MREVTQTIMAGETDGVIGNCLQACVASVLDLPLDAVPHFSAFLWWPEALRLWAKGEGWEVKGETTSTVPDRLCIVGGVSPRGFAHVVVGQHGRVVWDPHPSRAGLTTIRDVTWFEPNGSRDWKDGVQAKVQARHTCTRGLIGSAYGCPACGLGGAIW